MRRHATTTYASSNPQDAIDEDFGVSASDAFAAPSTASFFESSPSTVPVAGAEGSPRRRTRAADGTHVESAAEHAPFAAASDAARRGGAIRTLLSNNTCATESAREPAVPASLRRACCPTPGAGERQKAPSADTLQRGTVWSAAAMQRAQAESGRVVLSAHGIVYDVTSFVDDHPGGTFAILSHAGEESTADFDFHTRSAKKSWTSFAIGRMERTGLLRWLLGP